VIGGLEWRGWQCSYSFIYVGERYTNSANITANYLQPWYTPHLGLSKVFVWRKIKIKASLQVNNLLNQYYEVVLNYPMPGRNYRLSVKVEV